MLDRNIPPNAIGRQTDLFGVTAMSFKALLTSKQGDTLSIDLVDFGEADLMAGDVTVAVDYSTINYKDGMSLTGNIGRTPCRASVCHYVSTTVAITSRQKTKNQHCVL